MSIVINSGDDSIEKMLKIMKRKLEKDGILRELRDREHYEKPSVKKRMKSEKARKRAKKREL